jgi:hypothetical protein
LDGPGGSGHPQEPGPGAEHGVGPRRAMGAGGPMTAHSCSFACSFLLIPAHFWPIPGPIGGSSGGWPPA